MEINNKQVLTKEEKKKKTLEIKEKIREFLLDKLPTDKIHHDIDFEGDEYDVIINRDETEVTTHITIIIDNITYVGLFHFQNERGKSYFEKETLNGEVIRVSKYYFLYNILKTCGYDI